MNEDYLWDKSGEPDPEIQQLEEILGTLRYQPRELEIPPHLQPRRKTYVTRGLAIAAAVALVALALGVWMRMYRQSTTQVIAERAPATVDQKSNVPAIPASEITAGNVQVGPSTNTVAVAPISTSPRRPTLVGSRRFRIKQSQLSESELAEATAARDQLMVALRVASSKLNLAQKKTQGNEIHNQHKTG